MNRYKILLLLLLFPAVVVAQVPCGIMLPAGDTVVCPGVSVRLVAQGMLECHWRPDALFADPGLAVQNVVTDTSTTYSVTGCHTGDNVVLNGDFSMGFAHFTSDYEYAGVAGPRALLREGRFAVGVNSHDYHGGFNAFGDHTTGDGNYLIVNGASSPGVTVWEQTVAVTPNTDYAFVTWLQTINGPNPARLQFSINGRQIGEIFEASSGGLWQQYHQIWNSDTATSAVITILNQNTAATGNDFGLDDISFSPVLPCTDSVRVVVVAPVSAVNDTFVVCSGDTLVACPTANDTVDSLCGTVFPCLLDICPHIRAVPAGTSIAFCADTSWNGVCDLRYSIGCCDICDTAVIHLAVNQSSTYEFTETVCESYEWNEQTYTESGNYTQTFTNAAGCDSVVTLHLTIRQPVSIEPEVVSACEEYEWHGETYTESGNHTYTRGGINGECDTTETLELTINQPVSIEPEVVSACEEYEWHGRMYTESDTYTYIRHGINSECDTTETLQLTINSPVSLEPEAIVVCEEYEWHGITYSESGNYTFVREGINGECDTTETLQLTINSPVSLEPEIVTACEEYEWHGRTYNESDTYTYTREGINGECDTTENLELTVLPDTDTCQRAFVRIDTILSSHIPHIEADGFYYIDLCPYDTLHIAAYGEYPDNNSRYRQSDSTSVFAWNFDTQTFNGTGLTAVDFDFEPARGYEASVSLTDVRGCPAQAPFGFRIRTSKNPIHGLTPVPDICAGQSFEFTAGYDLQSVVRLNPVGSEQLTALAVSDTIFLPDGQPCLDGQQVTDLAYCSYVSPVTFTSFSPSATITSPNDLLYVRLSIEHSYIGDLWIRLTCPNGSYVSLLKKCQSFGHSGCTSVIPATEWGWPGTGSSGNFLGNAYDGESSSYCDPNDAGNEMGTCWNYCWSNADDQGYQYNPGNYVYSDSNKISSGQFYYSYLDSTNVAQMTNVFHPDGDFNSLIGCPLNGTWSIEVMDGWGQDNGYVCGWELALDPDLLPHDWSYSVAVDTVYVTGYGADGPVAAPDTAGELQYTVHVVDEYGCEYRTGTALHVNPNLTGDTSATVCDNGLPFRWHGISCDSSGDYTHTFQSRVTGCDSVVTLHLTVNQSSTYEFTETACDSYEWNGQTYTQSGDCTQTFTNAAGCDSTVTLHLTVNKSSASEFTETACDSYEWNGQTYTESGDCTQTLTNAAGCDSTVTLHLTVNETAATTFGDTVCSNALPYVWDGREYDTAGDYRFTYSRAITGCDSTVTLLLAIAPTYDTLIQTRICEGAGYRENGFDISSTETVNVDEVAATRTLQSVYGCDSVVRLRLSVIDTSLAIVSSPVDFCDEFYTELTAVTPLPDYVWSTGETTDMIAVTSPGTYSVTAYGPLCSATARHVIPACGLVLHLPNSITPDNSDGLNDCFGLLEGQRQMVGEFEIDIFNRWGEHVFHSNDKGFRWYGDYKGKTVPNAVYSYRIRCTDQSGRPFMFSGSITVL